VFIKTRSRHKEQERFDESWELMHKLYYGASLRVMLEEQGFAFPAFKKERDRLYQNISRLRAALKETALACWQGDDQACILELIEKLARKRPSKKHPKSS
jgi:hypothetical protein